jgi:hypothetical protein
MFNFSKEFLKQYGFLKLDVTLDLVKENTENPEFLPGFESESLWTPNIRATDPIRY